MCAAVFVTCEGATPRNKDREKLRGGWVEGGGDNLWNRYLGNLWTSCMATCGVSSSATCGNSTGCRVCQMISDALGNMWNDSTGCRGWNIHNLTHFHPFSSDQMTRNLSMKKWGLDFCSTRLLCFFMLKFLVIWSAAITNDDLAPRRGLGRPDTPLSRG